MDSTAKYESEAATGRSMTRIKFVGERQQLFDGQLEVSLLYNLNFARRT